MLSKQLQKQIEQEAVSRYGDLPNGIHTLQRGCYKRGAGKYATLYETTLARAERAEKALKDFAKQIKMHCNKMGIRSVVIQCIANRMEELDITEALTHKTGEDE